MLPSKQTQNKILIEILNSIKENELDEKNVAVDTVEKFKRKLSKFGF